jgi:dTDP-4-dehydrorhamnose 3,5-epimerase
VIIDLRAESPTFRQWLAVEITADNRRMLFIPRGFSHGFRTLVDDTEVFHQMSEFYAAESARWVRWDDPALMASWPAEKRIISERDHGFPDFLR